jgi:long-chain acyl-CoA synthetase
MNSSAHDRRQPLHECVRNHARAQPRKPAIIWYGFELSYGELDRLSDGFAERLRERGVSKGDAVALFMHNCPQYVIAHFGVQKLGAIVGPCSPVFKEHELAYQVGDLGAKVIVAADDLVPMVLATKPKTALEHVFAIRYGDFVPAEPAFDVPEEMRTVDVLPSGVIDFIESVHTAPPFTARPSLSLDDVALMTYTSGTTGMPKGAMLTYGNALFKTAAGAAVRDIGPDSMILGVAPIYHIAGMITAMNLPLYVGATVVLLKRFDPRAALQAIERYRITWWHAMAPMLVAMMNVPDADRFDLGSLDMTAVTSFGVTLTETLAKQWSDLANGCLTCEAGYGLSETHTSDVLMPPEAIKWGTHGKPVAGVEVRIVDSVSGRDLAPGEKGEIALRSAGVFKGYWNKPEATAATLRDGWVFTGDIGMMDHDGYLTFLGRIKEMIKVSGYSVFPEEVETILIKHPGVAQAAVIGLPDPAKGEVVQAFLVLKPEARDSVTVENVIAWCRENMSYYKVPRSIEFRDSLPATGAGKVLRRLLKSN